MTLVSVMLAVPDAAAASARYRRAAQRPPGTGARPGHGADYHQGAVGTRRQGGFTDPFGH